MSIFKRIVLFVAAFFLLSCLFCLLCQQITKYLSEIFVYTCVGCSLAILIALIVIELCSFKIKKEAILTLFITLILLTIGCIVFTVISSFDSNVPLAGFLSIASSSMAFSFSLFAFFLELLPKFSTKEVENSGQKLILKNESTNKPIRKISIETGYNELKKLKELLDSEILSKEEFEKMKKNILEKI